MNWGKAILLGMGTFMLFIIILVVYMFKAPADDYDKNYYEKGLAYDNEYQKEKNVVEDFARPDITLSNDTLLVNFVKPVTGKLIFNRPANRSLDTVIRLDNQEAKVGIPVKNLAKGRWLLIFDWQTNSKKYLYKHEISLP